MLDSIQEYFMRLIQISSESKNEKQVAEQICHDLANLGAVVEQDDCHKFTGGNSGNIYAFFPGNSKLKPILFCAHLDTVKPGNNVKPLVSNGVIHSDGKTILGADDKSGIAEIIFGIKQVLESGVEHAPIEVLFTVSEEIGLLGAKHFDIRKLKSEIGYAFDAQDIGEFMIGAPSQNSFHIVIHGKEAHAGVEPEKGISAIRIAAEAISSMPLGRIDFETTANIGIIEGGVATNIVAKQVEIKGEARSHNQQKLDDVTNQITNCVRDVVGRYHYQEMKANCDISVINEYKSFNMDMNTLVVKNAQQACEKLGIECKMIKGGGGSDANILNLGAPDIIVAGTGMNRYHTVEEYISIDDLEQGAVLVTELIKIYSGVK